MNLKPPTSPLSRAFKTLSLSLLAAAGASAVTQSSAVRPEAANGLSARPVTATARDTAGVLVPVAGARNGSYEEVSRVITRKQWQVLNKAQRGMIRNMLMDARNGNAPYEACFAPGTQPEVVRAFEAADSSLSAFRIGTQWTQTVTNPSLSRGQAVTLTWSIVPDGTVFSTGDGTGNSNLRAWATTTYGSVEAFRAHMRAVFNEYEQFTGVRYVELNVDDGAAIPNAAGAANVRGDIRIGGRNIDGTNNVLAYNYFPNSGDMVIDTADAFYDEDRDDPTTPLRGFINVLTHEHGHGLGLEHVCPVNQTKLMEPFVSYAFEGAQPDDIAAVQRNYGDSFESPSGNDTTGTASNLGTLTVGTTSRTNLSIDGSDDTDVFRFAKDVANRTATITVTPLGTPYLDGDQLDSGGCSAGVTYDPRNRRDLAVELLDGNGNLMARADNTAAGSPETITVTGLTSSANHFVRVTGSGIDAIQMYSLEITLGTRVNVAPSVVVSLAPAIATTTSTLTATITKSDPESNPITQTIRWLADGVVIPGQTGTTLNLAAINTIEPGDLITVEVTADDGNGAAGRGTAFVRLQEPAGLIVTTLSDVVASDGVNSLREAYAYAATLPAAPVPEITFKAGLTGTLTLGSALPQLGRSVKITGPGSATLALGGNLSTRFMQIAPGGALQVSGLTFKEFAPSFSDEQGFGGVFYMTGGSLTASGCTFRNNEAINGGGVLSVPDSASAATTMIFTDCSLTDNAARFAGALSLEGVGTNLQMTRCTVNGNESLIDTGNPSAPGAIYAVNPAALTFTGTTFSNNVGPAGGALYIIDGSSIPVTIDSCTFSGNNATVGNGGAIRDSSDGLTVRNSTFVNNDAVGNGGAVWDFGAAARYVNCTFSNNAATTGFALNMEQNVATLLNSIFHRGAISGTAPLLSVNIGSYVSGGNNLFSDAAPANFTKLASDKTGVDPQLSALADNGGQVLTMAIGVTSPALEAGSNAVTGAPDNLATDARGTGFPRKVGSLVDIGAFERGAIVDAANPVVAFTAPASGASLTSLPAVSGTATDDVSVTAVTFRLQRASDSKFWTGSAWGASTELTTTLSGAVTSRTWTRTTGLPAGADLAPGNYTLTATATDSSAKTGTAARGFSVPVANAAPTVAFTAPASGASLTTLPAISGTATDDVTVSMVTFTLKRASDNKFWTGSAWGAETALATTLGGTVTNRTWTRTTGLPAGADLVTGSYTLTATATDSGALTGTATRTFSVPVPNAPPTVTFTAPASGASLTSLPAVSGTATDDVTVSTVTFTLKRASDSKFWTGSAWGAETALTTTLGGTATNRTWTRTTGLPAGADLGAGSYTLTATATDSNAATATATRGFTVPVPNAPPVVAFTAPDSGASLTALPAVSGTATDDVAVTKVTLRIQRASDSKFWTGAAWGASTELTTALTGAVNNRTWTRNSDLPSGGNLVPGSYTLTATATDGGALTGTATRSFTVPTPSAPTVAFTAPASGASLGSLTTVSGTVTDALGISGVTFRLQRASDSKFWTGSAWGASTELTTTPAGTLTDGTWSRSADLPAGTDLLAGSYTLTATATNTSAVTATATRSFTVPVPTAPVVAFSAPAAGASLTSLPAVSGTATDDVLVTAVTFRLQRASDNKFWTGSAWGASTELTTTLGGTPTSRTWTRTTDLPFGANLVAGSYTLTATATNGSALTGTATQGFTVPTPATATAVVATVTTPINGSSIKALTLANGTVVDKTGGSGISKVEITLQRVSDLKFWSGTNWVVTSTPLPTGVSGNVWTKGAFPAAGTDPDTQLLEGKYIITAKATNLTGDVSANTATSKTQFTVDRSVPTDLVIINPVFNGKLKGVPKLNGTVKDNLGVASVQLILQRSTDAKSWNGTSWVAAQTLLATNVAGPVTDRVWSLSTGLPTGENLVLGTYALTAIATDYAGNKTTLPWRFVITEGDRPTVTITSPANATTVSSLTTISGVAGDTGGSSLASVQLTLRRMSDNTYWKGSAWVPESSILPTQVTAVTAFNFNWVCTVMPKGADLLDGVYRAQATAFDRAGNISSIYQVQFTYKKAAALTRSSRVVLSSANAAGGEDGLIQLLFTGALAGSATDATNYSVTLDGEPVEVFSARQKSPGLIILTTDGLASGSRIAVNYYLQDTSGGNVTGTANVTVK